MAWAIEPLGDVKQMIDNKAKRSRGGWELFTLAKVKGWSLHVRHQTPLAVTFKRSSLGLASAES